MGMTDTVRRWCSVFGDNRHRESLRSVLEPIADRLSCQMLSTAGLVIKTGGSALAKSGSADAYASVNGVLVKISASTDMPALPATVITAGSYNVVCFFIDSAGTKTSAMGTEATTLAAVKWPPFPTGKAFIGCLIINDSATFTGGTTALDNNTATVYQSPIGAFDPSILPS